MTEFDKTSVVSVGASISDLAPLARAPGTGLERLAAPHPIGLIGVLPQATKSPNALRDEPNQGYATEMTDMPSASMQRLARRLLTLEALSQSAADPHVHEGVRVCEKLQISVTRFAGSDGFAALLRRALALARADNPLLQTVELKPDGSLNGCEVLAADGREGAVAIIAHLLGLLETFVGVPSTLRLVRQAWPDASLDS